MKSRDEPIPRNNKGKWENKKPNRDQANAYPSEDRRNDGIYRLDLGENSEESKSDSEWLIAKSRESQKKNIGITVLNVNVTFYIIF